MASSTSHSESRVPTLLCRLGLTALLAWTVSAVYTLWVHPENRFLKAAAHTKQAWARKLTGQHGAKFVVVGSSSCTFSIDGERMLARHQLPLVNMGLFKSISAKTLTEWALTEIRPGDSLILAFEPGVLSDDILPDDPSYQFCYAMGSPRWIGGVQEPASPVGLDSLLALRPGGRHAVLLAGKILSRRPLFRYALEDIRPSGWVETKATGQISTTAGGGPPPSPEGRILLRSVMQWCQTNQVRVCLTMPVIYCLPEALESTRQKHAAYLLDVAQYLPVLEDRRLGVHTNRSLFADTARHFNAEGVAQRTDELAEPLRAWRMWNLDELRALAGGAVSNSVPR